jgi:cysteinyl-tRNA synthetase
LNTPKAIAQIHYILGELEKQISNKDARWLVRGLSDDNLFSGEIDENVYQTLSENFFHILRVIKTIDWFDKSVLKLNLLESSIKELEKQLNIPQEIKELAEKRWKAKLEKNYELADKLRAEIRSKWYEVVDKKNWYEIIKR